MTKHQISRKAAFVLSALLVAVLFTGCLSPQQKTEIGNWWNACITDSTNGDMFITVLLASILGGWISK